MAAWSRRTRTIVHRELVLASPAHYTDVLAAIEAAEHELRDTTRAGDLTIRADDDQIVIGYSTEETP